MKPISRRRFDALAGYVRSPWMFLSAIELAGFEEGDEKLLGLISMDRQDRDYVATVLGRDALGRFRAVDVQINIPTPEKAHAALEVRLQELVNKPAEFFHQGDEHGRAVDFFSGVTLVENRSQAFELLRTAPHWTPALGLFRELMRHFNDVDGNFIQQFQTSGFDARLWELYLYALFTELGYGLDRTHVAPDFHCVGPLGEFFVEATTVNPSADEPKFAEENRQRYYDDYVPRKFGSALYSKVQKNYSNLQHVQGHPLVLAIQDFHTKGAMVWSNTGLVEYLYGIKQTETADGQGKVKITSTAIDTHEWDGKTIPSNFFKQQGSENVSAVLANPGGTLSMFNRMGLISGFGDQTIKMIRRGYAYQGGLSPAPFAREVNAETYDEDWCQGLSVYHNPNAARPLPESCFPGAAHHTSRDGRIVSSIPDFFPLGSHTIILNAIEDEKEGVDIRSEAPSLGDPPTAMEDQDYVVTQSKPGDLSEAERDRCFELIRLGGAANVAREEIDQAALIARAKKGDELVAVGAIKRVRRDYTERIAKKAKFELSADTPEMGYISVRSPHRNKHLSTRIVKQLLDGYAGAIYATTSDPKIKHINGQLGFSQQGNEWESDLHRGVMISLWVRNAKE